MQRHERLLAQIEDICDRVAILDRGQLMLEGAVRDLVGVADRQALVVEKLSPDQLAELRVWLAARGRTLSAVEQPPARPGQTGGPPWFARGRRRPPPSVGSERM